MLAFLTKPVSIWAEALASPVGTGAKVGGNMLQQALQFLFGTLPGQVILGIEVIFLVLLTRGLLASKRGASTDQKKYGKVPEEVRALSMEYMRELGRSGKANDADYLERCSIEHKQTLSDLLFLLRDAHQKGNLFYGGTVRYRSH